MVLRRSPGTLEVLRATARRSWRPLSLSLPQPVTDPRLVEDVGRVFRVFTQLAPEVLHDGAHRPGAADVGRTPDPQQQVGVVHHPPGAGGKLGQHQVLHVCQPGRTGQNQEPRPIPRSHHRSAWGWCSRRTTRSTSRSRRCPRTNLGDPRGSSAESVGGGSTTGGPMSSVAAGGFVLYRVVTARRRACFLHHRHVTSSTPSAKYRAGAYAPQRAIPPGVSIVSSGLCSGQWA